MEKEVKRITSHITSKTGLEATWENVGKIASKYDQYEVTLLTINNLPVGHFYLQDMGGYLAFFFNDETQLSDELNKWITSVVSFVTYDAVTSEEFKN